MKVRDDKSGDDNGEIRVEIIWEGIGEKRVERIGEKREERIVERREEILTS